MRETSNGGTEVAGMGTRTMGITPLVHVSDGFKERLLLDNCRWDTERASPGFSQKLGEA